METKEITLTRESVRWANSTIVEEYGDSLKFRKGLTALLVSGTDEDLADLTYQLEQKTSRNIFYKPLPKTDASQLDRYILWVPYVENEKAMNQLLRREGALPRLDSEYQMVDVRGWTHARIVKEFSKNDLFLSGYLCLHIIASTSGLTSLLGELSERIGLNVETEPLRKGVYRLWVPYSHNTNSNDKFGTFDLHQANADAQGISRDEAKAQLYKDLYSEDLDTHTNAAGGKQSDVPGRFDLLPADAIAEVALVLKHGADKYGEENWRKIPVNDHINHALRHIFAVLKTGNKEDLSHATTRLLFALDLHGKEV